MDYFGRLADKADKFVVLLDANGSPLGAVPLDDFRPEHCHLCHQAEVVEASRLIEMRLELFTSNPHMLTMIK